MSEEKNSVNSSVQIAHPIISFYLNKVELLHQSQARVDGESIDEIHANNIGEYNELKQVKFVPSVLYKKRFLRLRFLLSPQQNHCEQEQIPYQPKSHYNVEKPIDKGR